MCVGSRIFIPRNVTKIGKIWVRLIVVVVVVVVVVIVLIIVTSSSQSLFLIQLP